MFKVSHVRVCDVYPNHFKLMMGDESNMENSHVIGQSDIMQLYHKKYKTA
jgi:hypothetical protein